ncbi:unnamed protein product [Albugo candida]|uniref:Uncharacterized protein n=1 Tax=Albugo candida TaxID=65357 RepID=A0A024GDA7_9STRA|nr:unnamed protein product [Albugo candida]|eukprot:CCI44673.1 unnamed protein product [Albugo candida]
MSAVCLRQFSASPGLLVLANFFNVQMQMPPCTRMCSCRSSGAIEVVGRLTSTQLAGIYTHSAHTFVTSTAASLSRQKGSLLSERQRHSSLWIEIRTSCTSAK